MTQAQTGRTLEAGFQQRHEDAGQLDKSARQKAIYPVIMSGGAGARLWPVSRPDMPKPFIRMPDGESLIEKTYIRAMGLPHVKGVLTLTNREFLFKTDEAYRGHASEEGGENAYILEPVGRDTAAAVALSAVHAAMRMGPETILLIMPADHIIAKQKAFAEAVGQAARLAEAGKIVTFGIAPSRPETGYGYIQASGNEVVRFVEKPSLEVALSYLESGDYLWNAGIFCFRADVMLEEMKRHMPDILDGVMQCYRAARGSDGMEKPYVYLEEESFKQVRAVSIDYALMEKSDKTAVIPCDIGWSDVGTWASISETLNACEKNNRISGNVVLHEVKNCFIQGGARTIGVVGAEDLIVVDAEDALLITTHEHAQNVKKLVEKIRLSEPIQSSPEERGVYDWGRLETLEDAPDYRAARLEIHAGAAAVLPKDGFANAVAVVMAGSAAVEGEMLHPGMTASFGADAAWTVDNTGAEILVVLLTFYR
ncbi:MAG: mannose-1-phosphate guanylyltransferase/mannose-6-phosphate isomerase [Micavibrio sp.]